MAESPTAVVAGRPLRRDAERNRQRILAAARVLFAAHGIDVGLDDIAHHAGVGVGTVYRRFPDRETLIDELLEEKIAAVEALAREALEADDPWAGFVRFFEGLQELHAANRALKQALLVPTCGRERLAAARSRIEPLVAELVARAQASGGLRADLRSEDFPLLVEMVAVVGEATHEADPALWRRYARLILDGLATSRAAPGDLGAEALDREHLVDALCTSSRER